MRDATLIRLACCPKEATRRQHSHQEAIMPTSRSHPRDQSSTIATPAEAKLKPGDDAAPGTPGAGEVFCPECHGRGRVDGVRCQMCGGTGKVTHAIGGA
jgi:hypothetical protein